MRNTPGELHWSSMYFSIVPSYFMIFSSPTWSGLRKNLAQYKRDTCLYHGDESPSHLYYLIWLVFCGALTAGKLKYIWKTYVGIQKHLLKVSPEKDLLLSHYHWQCSSFNIWLLIIMCTAELWNSGSKSEGGKECKREDSREEWGWTQRVRRRFRRGLARWTDKSVPKKPRCFSRNTIKSIVLKSYDHIKELTAFSLKHVILT